VTNLTEATLLKAFHGLSVGVMILSPSLEILFINRWFAKALGRDDLPTNCRLLEICPELEGTPLLTSLARGSAQESQTQLTSESTSPLFPLRNPETLEEPIMQQVQVSKFDLEDGTAGVMVQVEDLSEIVEKEHLLTEEAYAALDRAQQDAEQALQAKSDFLSSMSEELRTPLNAILGFTQVLEAEDIHPLSDTQQKQLNYIKRGGDHLLKLTDDIMDLSRVESGALSLVMEKVDCHALIMECLSFSSSLAATRDITVEHMIDEEIPHIWADHLRTRQAILNLLSNAINYNRFGEMVWLDVQHPDEETLRISVTDTGLGIPADRQSELFQPFNRLGAEATGIEGSGIGLVFTKKIVEEMGGSLGFSSLEGRASTFWIDLPVVS
jgi:signal transduction histidine kinase